MRVQDFKLSDAGSHPNKVPFKCALFAIGTPSDGSPHGAGGKKIRIASSVCDKNLHTFVGMALNIDYANGMADHDPRFKVAVIEKAYRAMDDMAWIEGYIYGKDFPDVVATIRYYNGLAAEQGWTEYQFGASLEMEAAVQDAEDVPNVLDVIDFCGTGAAILFAEAAAYNTTSIAAKNKTKEDDVEMTPEQIKAMQDALKAAGDGITALTASVQTIVTEVSSMKTDMESLKASSAAAEVKTEEQKTADELKAANDRAAAAEQELADLKAGKGSEPQRKTLSAAQMLSKFGGDSSGDDSSNDIRSFCASVDKLGLPPTESIRLKMQARKELSSKESV